ncbi:hypothetical protein [Leptospira idonii]|uniref:Uncharacterized protein n=1 Tax=Leptospira idonii TaxID=1193500 RepID=A0A4R9LY65_9LEPT|nr:hypothetical protein [Leptospira idonii]TGN19253.1 hypothetical protein EHS15_10080 [Leptospira idonii]
MKPILISFLLLAILLSTAQCSLFKKSDDDKDLKNLLLLGFLLRNNGACNPESGFTICIPKGIAE